ncbi:TetR/AcrR family transcriptional regulator [Pedobacter yulinensis]|uniref:TetR/AcrR family transcriptional regulator n=1 Tax=Pedobacter yulinensis TaxID=2126353 RepID=A0A2T3HJY9_9SPHI|nr:TetR/AcrR family transcriptional regulator [Pedobacter yulinensis]PST82757.1 TetR/AcrR family transcriptional regulator [Pedobacter yulinensis]
MPAKNTGTKELIKDTARRLLFAEGRLYVTTQDIADAAGMNRAAVHYYFKTRDLLIAEVFNESMAALSQRLGSIMEAEKPFRNKLETLIEVYATEMAAFPYEETFLVAEMNQAGQQLVAGIDQGPVAVFLADVARQMDSGAIEKMEPVQFLINLFSLLSYPVMMAPLYRQFFGLSVPDFDRLLADRKALILSMLLKG